MDTAKIVHELDAEIARLASARKILAGGSANARYNGRLGISATRRTGRKRRSGLTAAGRKRLSELMKKRWAERRKKAAARAK